MKKSELRQIIREEFHSIMKEDWFDFVKDIGSIPGIAARKMILKKIAKHFADEYSSYMIKGSRSDRLEFVKRKLGKYGNQKLYPKSGTTVAQAIEAEVFKLLR